MNPYPGLRPYRSDESRFYMGREVLTSAVTTTVRSAPLTVLFARSGVGKSSFLQCRLIPDLRVTSAVRCVSEWGATSPAGLLERTIAEIMASRSDLPERPVVVLDQFEDVFKLSREDEVNELWDRLAAYTNIPDSPVSVLVSMREEWLGFWGEAEQYLPHALQSTIRLRPLSQFELRRAIIRPPMIEGTLSVADGLVDVLLKDLTQRSMRGSAAGWIEPGLLQLVCHRLWAEAVQRESMMDVALYEELGGADNIIRSFVWRELAHVDKEDSVFSSRDRVLWGGLTRHLVVAQGIKAITTSTAVARRVRIEDLGIAGRAVVKYECGDASKVYLGLRPEARGFPPVELTNWITRVLDKGVAIGFLKVQSGLTPQWDDSPANDASRPSSGDTPDAESHDGRLYELAHDALGDIFRDFSVEFETWLRRRWYKVVAALWMLFVAVPFFIYMASDVGLSFALLWTVGMLVVTVLYILLIRLLQVVFGFLGDLISFPILRRIAKGSIPMVAEGPVSGP